MARKGIYPESVTPGIPRLGEKPEGWVETTFGKVLRVVKRPVQMDDDTEYQLVLAKRSRGGIVPRSRLLGKDIRTKTQFYIGTGDFLISKRQIVHGACGIVPPELDGAIVSNEYVTLRTKPDLLLEYLQYFCHTPFFQQTCFQASVGVDVEKMIFDAREWLSHRLFLPPTPEQSRIGQTLGAWDKAIALTERLIEAKRRGKKVLADLMLTGRRRFGEPGDQAEKGQWREVPLGTLIHSLEAGVSANSEDRPGRLGEPGILKTSAVADGLFRPEENKVIVEGERHKVKVQPRKDRIIVSRANTVELVGASAYVDQDYDDLYLPDKLWQIEPKRGAVSAQWLGYAISSGPMRRKVSSVATGTSGSMKNISQQAFLSLQIALPPLSEQLSIAQALGALDEEVYLLDRNLALLRKQRKGLMQKLLTGRVRITTAR